MALRLPVRSNLWNVDNCMETVGKELTSCEQEASSLPTIFLRLLLYGKNIMAHRLRWEYIVLNIQDADIVRNRGSSQVKYCDSGFFIWVILKMNDWKIVTKTNCSAEELKSI